MHEISKENAKRYSSSRTFSVCLAEILKTPVDEIPCAAEHIDFDKIGWWLATRNLALIPVKDPESFQWAGWWIARLDGGNGYVVMAGTPSDVAWTPSGVTRGAGNVIEGWVVAAPALSLPSRNALHGTIESIYRFSDSGAPGELISSASLIANVGVDGDRYALGKGHFQGRNRWGQALTLIETESIDALATEYGISISDADARRNIVCRDIDLNTLLGKRFIAGKVLCYGQRLAEPCAWLQKTTPPGTLRGLVHRGGLRADILESGVIQTGDTIRAE